MEWLLFDYIFDVTPVGIMVPVCVLCVCVCIHYCQIVTRKHKIKTIQTHVHCVVYSVLILQKFRTKLFLHNTQHKAMQSFTCSDKLGREWNLRHPK